MQTLAEQYRPRTLDDVIGQEKAVKRLKFLADRGYGGRSFWINGISGSGKTTLARIIADEVAGEWSEEIDAAECTPRAIMDWERRLRCKPLGGKGWSWICNESHGLRKDAVRQFLVTLERLPSFASVIFTTTNSGELSLFGDNEDAGPLTSRCTVIALEANGSKLELSFACHLRSIAEREGMEPLEIDAYIALVRSCKFNLRAALQELESGALVA